MTTLDRATWRERAAARGGGYCRDQDGNIVPFMMANWPKYVIDNPDDLGARMLGLSLDEIDRLCAKCVKQGDWAARLLFAYVETWERLRKVRLSWLMGKVQPPAKPPLSFGNALSSIGMLNRWRAENPERGEP